MLTVRDRPLKTCDSLFVMKTYYSNPIKFRPSRLSQLIGIMLWSAHYHGGQASREYRMGCRARKLLERSNEIGSFLASKWFDSFEPYVSGGEAPRTSVLSFAENVKKEYAKLEFISQREMEERYEREREKHYDYLIGCDGDF